jgi:hypothetical protein
MCQIARKVVSKSATAYMSKVQSLLADGGYTGEPSPHPPFEHLFPSREEGKSGAYSIRNEHPKIANRL